MRRGIVIALFGVVAVVLVAGIVSSLGGSSGYKVRAVFDNAGFAVTGEDVTVAGAVVGKIDSLQVTSDQKAVVNLLITDPRFAPFHADATCTIRSEGLLAVKYVDCNPGAASQPALSSIAQGPGAGWHELSVQRTSSPVDLDLVNNMLRQPRGQELAILLSELGTGLAARGSDLNAVIHRANPGLGQTDQVLRILAGQNRRLAQLAVDADTALAPLTRQQRALAGFVTSAAATSAATASRRDALGRSLARLPAFLRELRPAMADLGRLTAQAIPVLSQLRGAAPGLDRATTELRQFATTGRAAVTGLGRLADRAGPALLRTQPLIGDLAGLARNLPSAAGNLDRLTASLQRGDSLKHFVQLLFYGTNSATGFDAVGHYVRLEPLSGACSAYTASGFFGCHATWRKAVAATAASAQTLIQYLMAP